MTIGTWGPMEPIDGVLETGVWETDTIGTWGPMEPINGIFVNGDWSSVAGVWETECYISNSN